MPWAETGCRSSFSGSHPKPQRPQLSPAETRGRGGPPSTWVPQGRCSVPTVSPAPQAGPRLQALSPTLCVGAESRGPWGSSGLLHRCWQATCVGTACASRRGQTMEVLLMPAGPGGESSLHTHLSLKARLVSISTFPDFCPPTTAGSAASSGDALGDPWQRDLCLGLF